MIGKLKVGDLLKFELPREMPEDPSDHAFAEAPLSDCRLEVSTGIFSKTREVTVDSSFTEKNKQHRNFRWLPYAPGRISWTPIDGTDVLSGKFSGCWMVVFKTSSGKYAVGHVGTKDNSAELNDAVKGEWINFAKANPKKVVGGFNPAMAIVASGPLKKAPDEEGEVIVLGGVTCNPEPVLYAIQLAALRKDGSKPPKPPTVKLKEGETIATIKLERTEGVKRSYNKWRVVKVLEVKTSSVEELKKLE